LKKLFTGVLIAALSVIGVVGVSMASASAGGARHVASYPPTQARNLPADQVIIIRCATMGSLQGDVARLDNYHKGMAPAGAWVEDRAGHNSDWVPANDFDATYRQFVCTVVTVTPPAPTTGTLPVVTTTVPVVTTLPATPPTTAPESPCQGLNDCQVICNNAAGVDDCNICIGNNDCDVIVCPVGFELDSHGNCDLVPTQPIETTTTEAPTTTVPVPVTRCVTLRHVQVCTLPPSTTSTTVEETTTTEAPTTTTEPEHECPPGEHPAPHDGYGDHGDHVVCIPDHPIVTTTTAAPTTTTEAPTTTTAPAEPGSPCQGIDDCHVVCNDGAGVDDCNICIGNQDCDAIICPVGYEVDSNGNCDEEVTPPIVTTTTEAPATTTTTEAPTTTTVEVTPLSVPHHYGH
jgi:hypothetical protein